MQLPKTFEQYRNQKIWVCFGEGKKPLNVRTLGGTCEKWNGTGTFDKAVSRIGDESPKFGRVLGAGFFFQKAGLIGIDLDHCVNNGVVDADAEEAVKMLNSYTEISVSGTGLHIVCKADISKTGKLGARVVLPDGQKKREIYNADRFFTITGNVYKNYSEIQERTDIIPEFLTQYIAPYQTVKAKTERQKSIKNVRVSDGLTPAAQAIQKHDYEYFRKKLKPKKQTFDNTDDFFNYLYRDVNLAEFLEVQEGQNFSCFFHRPDVHPSAAVYKDLKRGSRWFYQCATCGISWTIKFVVEKLGDFSSEVDSLEFLKKALNVSIAETTWTKKQLKTLEMIEDRILRTDDESFSNICKVANANMRESGRVLFLQILNHAKKNIYPKKYFDDENVIFEMSVRTLAKEAGRKGTSPDRINQWIVSFARQGMITKMSDASIPKDLLRKAQRKAGSGKNHVNFYRIYPWVINRLLYIESQAVEFKRLGYTVSNMRYRTVCNAEGQAVADRLFLQPTKAAKQKNLKYKTMGETANQRAQERENRIHEILVEQLRSQGYVTVSSLLNEYKDRYKDSYMTAETLKTFMPDLIETYGLTAIRATAEIKEKYGIETKTPRSYPKIYVLPE